MANIEQGIQSANQPNRQPVDGKAHLSQQKKQGVSRGYQSENSYSVESGPDETEPKIDKQHNLDAPSGGSDSPSEKVLKEINILNEILNKQGSESKGEKSNLMEAFLGSSDPNEAIDKALAQQNPLSKSISAMVSNKDKLLSLGYSEAVVDGMLSLADPNDPDNSLASMHSLSSRMTGKFMGDDSLSNMYNLFSDAFIKIANLKGGPAELHEKLQKDLKLLTGTFVNAKQELDVDTVTSILGRMIVTLQDQRLKYSQENIKIQQAEKEKVADKRMKKLLAAIEKQKEAKKGGFFGGIKNFFVEHGGKLAAGLGIGIAGILIATGIVSGVGVALMALSVALMVTMMVSAETGDWMNKEVAALLVKMGVSEDVAMIVAMVFWTVLTVVLSLGGAAASSGTASGAATAANVASKAGTAAAGGASSGATVTASATTAASTAAKVSKFTEVANRITKMARMVQGGTMVATGGAEAHNTYLESEANKFKAEARELFAWMMAHQHAIDDLVEDIRKVVEDMQQVWQVIMSIMKDNADTKSKLNAALKG